MTAARWIKSFVKEKSMNIPRQVVSFLGSRGKKLATAESCTAGEIASLLASVPGSGTCLDVGFIAYSPTGKAGFLGVRQKTMDEHGLTSEAVAREMAEGALRQEGCCADIAVSNTGVADGAPAGGPAPGTQCFAWSFRTDDGELTTFCETRQFAGGRNEVRHAAAIHALSRIEHYFNLLPVRGRRARMHARAGET
jgi:nicotinamide-nucleotide amidase